MKESFSGVERLYGTRNFHKIKNAHIAIIGIGGVGSWTAEALARSGVGKITLMDLDDICVTNINRQIHSDVQSVGAMKVIKMGERIKAINPDIELNLVEDFFTLSSSDELFKLRPDLIVDAIDSLKAKCELITTAKEKGVPLVSCGGAAGKQDATQIMVKDLGKTHNDPLLFRLRKKLRREFGWRGKNYQIPCIFSPEKMQYFNEGELCEVPSDGEGKISCEYGLGTASFITGTFGFLCAQEALKLIINEAN